MDKKTEILDKQKKKDVLKKEIQIIKKKVPTFIIGFIFSISVSMCFLETRFYNFFSKYFYLIIFTIIFLCLFSIFYIFKSYYRIKKIKIESKAIGSQLYQLMKLEAEPKNE